MTFGMILLPFLNNSNAPKLQRLRAILKIKTGEK
jgi:hypothetical protein